MFHPSPDHLLRVREPHTVLRAETGEPRRSPGRDSMSKHFCAVQPSVIAVVVFVVEIHVRQVGFK
jgi:hypothetical protein